jgi:hypothetical protein
MAGRERLEHELRATSWSDLQEHLFEGAWNPKIQRFRSPYAFRGVGDAKSGLLTSLARLGGSYVDMEAHLLRNFRKYALRDTVEADSLWHWLSLAQHHGLPTRLLDWTYSPFVAMHFATANLEKFDHDGAIWAVDYLQAHKLLPQRLREALEAEGSDVLTVEGLAEAVRSLHDLAGLSKEPFLLFFEPPSMDDRIVNQYALFSVLSEPQGNLQAWLSERPQLRRKVVIPAELKWEIRDKLDQANITERVLFPGLDGLSRWLKRLYSSREPANR